MLPLRDELLDLWLASMFPDASPADLQTKRAELAQAMEWVEVWILYRVRFSSSARLILSTQLLTRELSVTARHHCPRHPGSRRARSGQLGRRDRDGQSRGGRSPRQDLRPENPGPPGLGSVGEERGEGAALTASHAVWRCSSCGRRATFALMTVCASKGPAYHPRPRRATNRNRKPPERPKRRGRRVCSRGLGVIAMYRAQMLSSRRRPRRSAGRGRDRRRRGSVGRRGRSARAEQASPAEGWRGGSRTAER